jgi:hypothetical protein
MFLKSANLYAVCSTFGRPVSVLAYLMDPRDALLSLVLALSVFFTPSDSPATDLELWLMWRLLLVVRWFFEFRETFDPGAKVAPLFSENRLLSYFSALD